jgi:hypothetical protein
MRLFERDGIDPPGWETASRMNGSPREPRDPTGSTGVSVGVRSKGQPEQRAEPRSGVGPVHSIAEPLEGTWMSGAVAEEICLRRIPSPFRCLTLPSPKRSFPDVNVWFALAVAYHPHHLPALAW